MPRWRRRRRDATLLPPTTFQPGEDPLEEPAEPEAESDAELEPQFELEDRSGLEDQTGLEAESEPEAEPGPSEPSGVTSLPDPPPEPPPSPGPPSAGDTEPAEKAPEPAVGPRREALVGRRRRRRRKVALVVVMLTVVGGAAAYGLSDLLDRGEDAPMGAGETADAVPEVSYTALVVGEAGDGAAVWMTLLGFEHDSGRGAVVYIPAHSAVEVPGRGLLPLGEALRGGARLQEIAAENLLGIQIDQTVVLDEAGAKRVADALAPLTVEVPSEVDVATATGTRRLFDEGLQEIGAARLVRLMFTVGDGGDDIDLGGRHLAFWEAALVASRESPAELASALAPGAGSTGFGQLIEALAIIDPPSRRLGLVPTSSIGVAGNELYSVDAAALAELLDDALGTPPRPSEEIAFQILNGVGTPGLGREVAELLIEEGFSVALTGNAQAFGQARTLIITYGDSEELRAAALRAKAALGVGKLRVSAQEQGIVDLTVVVGKDFQRRQ